MKFYTLLFITLIITIKTPAQFQERFMNNVPGENFYDIEAKADSFFVANPDTTEGGPQNLFEKWELMWKTRVSSPDSTINGTFTPALRALQSAMVSPICTSPSAYPAN